MIARPPLRLLVVLQLLFAASSLLAAPKDSDRVPERIGDKTEARARFQKGVQLFRDGSFDASLAEFRTAYQIAPSYRLLYNIAQVEYERHDYVQAFKSFQRYLAEGGDEIPAERNAQVQAELRRLEEMVGKLRVTTSIAGAEVSIDGLAAGTSPLSAPLLVNPGERKISATKPGYTGVARSITIAGGDDVELSLELDQSPRPVAGVGQSPLAKSTGSGPRSSVHPRANRTAFWLTLTTTSVLAVGTGSMAFVTWHAKQKRDDDLLEATTPERLSDDRSSLVTSAAVTDALAGATLVSGGLMLYFLLSSGSSSSESAEPKPTISQLTVAPSLAGLQLNGAF